MQDKCVYTVCKKVWEFLNYRWTKDSASALEENSLCCNKQPLLDGGSLLRRDAKQQGSIYYEEKHFFFTLCGWLNPVINCLISVIKL